MVDAVATSGARGLPLRPVLTAAIPTLVLSMVTANPALTMVAVASLAVITALLWRSGESAVVFFICFMQWLQGSLKVFQADVLGVDVWTLSKARSLEPAIFLTLLWVTVLALGCYLALTFPRRASQRVSPFDNLTVPQLVRIYIAWTVILQVFAAFTTGGMRQVLVAFSDMRWAVVFAIFWRVLREGRRHWLLAVVFGFELAVGFLSYFSNFKIPLYLLAVALPLGNYRIRLRHVLGGLILSVFVLYLGIIWSAIKMEYRSTISGGAMDQGVQVGRGIQAQELMRLFSTVDKETMERGFEGLIDRVSYVDYFALTMDFVPAVHPHEDGLLWGRVLGHVLTPRLFFPNKTDLESDTEVTERYTGLDLDSSGRATSIALGTPAETYVDFGTVFMFVPALLVGMLWGLAYCQFCGSTASGLAEGFAVALILPLASLEHSPAKLVGGLLVRVLMATLLWKSLLPLALRFTIGKPVNLAPHADARDLSRTPGDLQSPRPKQPAP